MSKCKAASSGLALFLLFLVPCLRAQQSVAPDVIIEAVVTGKSGFARDLTAKNFTLSIDGRQQAIRSAVLQSAASPRRGPSRSHLILLFDAATLSAADQARVRQQVERFIDASAGPDCNMAVFKWFAGIELVQPFTTDAARLKKALEQVAASAATGVGSRGMLSSGYGAEESGRTGGGTPIQGWGDQIGWISKTQYLFQSLAALGDSLAPIPGRKAVVFLTGGGYALSASSEVDSYVDAAMLACNRANVALHGISNDSAFAYLLSSRTGGSSMRMTGSLSGSLEKIAQEQDAYYLVAFSPLTAVAQGCHKVRLTVPDGFEVRARREYCAPSHPD